MIVITPFDIPCILTTAIITKSTHPEAFCKKSVFKDSQNSQESTCDRVSLFVKLFSGKFCEIFKKIFLYTTSRGNVSIFQ